MMSEYKVLVRLKRAVKRLRHTSRDISDRGEYVVGKLNGLNEGIEIIRQTAWHATMEERKMRSRARLFTKSYLLGRLIRAHDALVRCDKYIAVRILEEVIAQSQKAAK